MEEPEITFQFFSDDESDILEDELDCSFEDGESSGEANGERTLKVRLDKWLWAARFFKTRAVARAAVEKGKVFYNGQKSKPSREIEIGAILQIRQGRYEKTVTVKGLSTRRRSTEEALQLFEETESDSSDSGTTQYQNAGYPSHHSNVNPYGPSHSHSNPYNDRSHDRYPNDRYSNERSNDRYPSDRSHDRYPNERSHDRYSNDRSHERYPNNRSHDRSHQQTNYPGYYQNHNQNYAGYSNPHSNHHPRSNPYPNSNSNQRSNQYANRHNDNQYPNRYSERYPDQYSNPYSSSSFRSPYNARPQGKQCPNHGNGQGAGNHNPYPNQLPQSQYTPNDHSQTNSGQNSGFPRTEATKERRTVRFLRRSFARGEQQTVRPEDNRSATSSPNTKLPEFETVDE